MSFTIWIVINAQDMFNWLSVIILFPVEIVSSKRSPKSTSLTCRFSVIMYIWPSTKRGSIWHRFFGSYERSRNETHRFRRPRRWRSQTAERANWTANQACHPGKLHQCSTGACWSIGQQLNLEIMRYFHIWQIDKSVLEGWSKNDSTFFNSSLIKQYCPVVVNGIKFREPCKCRRSLGQVYYYQ